MRVGIALSGGVDSLYAASCLVAEGHNVIGLHMRLISDEASHQNEEQLKPRARELGIDEFYVVDLTDIFSREVINPFVEEYKKGMTPNPCTRCNHLIKFGILANVGFESFGIDCFATGHYARIVSSPYTNGRKAIAISKDKKKDQSYFLFALSQEQLKRIIFPLGDKSKEQAKEWACIRGFTDLIDRESQDVCFMRGKSYVEFIEQFYPNPSLQHGPIRDTRGIFLGYHKGVHRFTIGQRRRIGIPSTEPYYVVELDFENHTVYVGRKNDVYANECLVGHVVWGAVGKPDNRFTGYVKIRQQHHPAEGTIIPVNEGTVKVIFKEPQPAITPGQAAVFYDHDEIILGGGFIQKDTGDEEI